MPDDDPPDIPDEDLEGIEDIAEAAEDEVPVWGTAKRVYRLVKKRLSKEYRKEIRRLHKKEKILIDTIDKQNENIQDLRRYIDELERQLKELENDGHPDDDWDLDDPNH